MIFDTHMHCQRSCDSKMTLTQAVARAKDLGIGMCVTEHWDYDYPTYPQAFHFDIKEYVKDAEKVRSDKVLLGIEIGMMPHLVEKNTKLAKSANFDYVLCSIHCVNRKDIYDKKFYTGMTKQQATEVYLKDMVTCLNSHIEIDALAHLDYIARYWVYGTGLDWHDAPDLWDEVFKVLAEREIPLELNTRRLPQKGVAEELKKIYARYKELGGKYMTTGSDAHNTDAVGLKIKEATELIRDWGMMPVYFKQRQMQLLS
ncbi:MAG: histidinol-phosphatase HisJ family protein [Acidaminococcaceae bacterium]|nr:histidinol-phosphatase HisJ family protein [Acidaminococcaceae bacterium]